jgi:hypothetical protein
MVIVDSIRNSICDVFDVVNGGSLRFHTTGHVAVATCPLAATAFGAPSSGTITAGTITSDTNTVAGTIDHAHLFTSGGTEQCTFTVSTTGAEINLSGLVFSNGDTLAVSSLTITMPAS